MKSQHYLAVQSRKMPKISPQLHHPYVLNYNLEYEYGRKCEGICKFRLSLVAIWC